jgi:peptidoglycan/LPS O-acetylase OafA/YrhL
VSRQDGPKYALGSRALQQTAGVRNPALDAVRGLAILLVIAYHYLYTLPSDFPSYTVGRVVKHFASFGWTGVDLFFVLSGFLIGGLLIDHKISARYFSTFYARRFVRIGPLYIASLCIFAFMYLGIDWRRFGLSGLFNGETPFWSYLTFLQNNVVASRGKWGGPGWLDVTWSLAVEEQFYLVLPAVVRFVPLRRLRLVCLTCIALAPAVRMLSLFLDPTNIVAPYVLFPCRMDALFFGVLAALIARDADVMGALQRWRLPLAGAWSVCLIGLAFNLGRIDPYAPSTQVLGYTAIGAFYFVSLLLVITGKPLSSRLLVVRKPLCWAGLGAYSMYLFHRPIQGLIEQGMGLENSAGRLLSLVCTAAFGVMCWLFIERPAIEWARRRFQYRARS